MTVKDDQPLSHHAVKSWHQLLTRHQSGAAGRDLDGRRVEIPLLKGEYKLRPNNPRRPDGVVAICSTAKGPMVLKSSPWYSPPSR